MSAKKWTRRDTRSISKDLKERGVKICPNSVAKLLKEERYSLRLNRKTISETHHPDRDRQFTIISEEKKRFEDRGQPILSCDTKKKELIGNFKNPGKAWKKKDQAEQVLTHDFRSDAVAITSPYGLFETLTNRGTVVVGTSSDTPAFAVDCLELWLKELGWTTYPSMKELLVLCDSGGSNGYRPRLWKYQLFNEISTRYGINIRVCHYPPGTSKWNPVEHRLFSFISMEWAGHPLRSIDLMLNYIRGTTTTTGLKVTAFTNFNTYQTGIKVSDAKFKQINIQRYKELPAWNYTISP